MAGKPGITSCAKSALQAAALAGASSLALSGAAFAQALDDINNLSGVTIEGGAREPDSPKYVAPLLDTPQTITIVDSELIEQQNLLNLRDVLSTLPGITFGAGEGGGGYGDSINLRGYSANNDISVDGVRDSAQYTRSDPFYIEQVEVTNGANSVYSGAGSIGGNINLVSKRPTAHDSAAITAGAGTDAYGRVTADVNQVFGDNVALRVNVMMHQNDAPGRDVESYGRFGIFPSLTWGLGGATEVTLAYLHQEDENIPQYGVPFAINAYNDGIIAGADIEAYYGWRNLDTQEITVDQATAIIDHAFGAGLSLRNLTRAQRVSQDAVISNLGGTYCTDAGVNPFTGAACAAPGTRTLSANGHTNFRFTENDLLYNQTDLSWDFATGAWQHSLVIGFALTHEEYTLDNGSPLYNADGTRPAMPVVDLANPDNVWTGPINFIRTGNTEAELDNYAIYVFDAIELSEHWELNGGVRAERQETTATNTSSSSTTGAVTSQTTGETEHDLFSYRLGLIFKPAPNASIYLAYGNSESPPQTSVLVRSACAPTDTACDSDPEEAETTELGFKWDLFDARLSLTGAIFRNERSAFYVASDIMGEPDRLDGRSRVDGVALGAAGLLTDDWTIFANYTYLDSELLQDVADALVATSFRSGDPLPYTPEHAFSLWTTYEPVQGLTIGYGATYQGEMTFNRAGAGAALYSTDAYWVHRALAAYEVTENFALQLNVNNLFDEEYYARVRNNSSNGWATPGEARSFVLSANLRY